MELLTSFGPAGAVVAVVIVFLRYISADKKDRRKDDKQRDITQRKVASALDRLTVATNKNTSATQSADTYLRERNGRDNEMHSEQLIATKEIPKVMQKIANDQAIAIVKALKIDKQTVKEQKVEHQTVRSVE